MHEHTWSDLAWLSLYAQEATSLAFVEPELELKDFC
jgi:hypothetical protein